MREIDKRYAPETGSSRIGHLLVRARRERGVSLEDAERATLIRKDFLRRLEGDDHSTMPEPIYVREVLRAYATFLGLDGDRLAAQVTLWQRRRTRRGSLWDR